MEFLRFIPVYATIDLLDTIRRANTYDLSEQTHIDDS